MLFKQIIIHQTIVLLTWMVKSRPTIKYIFPVTLWSWFRAYSVRFRIHFIINDSPMTSESCQSFHVIRNRSLKLCACVLRSQRSEIRFAIPYCINLRRNHLILNSMHWRKLLQNHATPFRVLHNYRSTLCRGVAKGPEGHVPQSYSLNGWQ